MGVFSNLVPSTLVEEENTEGWDKKTVEYVLGNSVTVHKAIYKMGKRYRILQKAEVDEIYQDLLEYLYKTDDYDYDKAMELSVSSEMIPLQAYVLKLAQYCIKRFITNKYKEDVRKVNNVLSDDGGTELNIFDTIADKKSEKFFGEPEYDLDEVCKTFECDRYSYGNDMFMMWYIRVKSSVEGKQYVADLIMDVLKIAHNDLSGMLTDNMGSAVMLSIAKAITALENTEEALSILRKYVYAADKIDELFEANVGYGERVVQVDK